MKVLFLVFTILLNLTVVGQKRDCQSLRLGEFKVTTKEAGTTFIKREGNVQIEENADLGAKVIFEIKWTTECSYELRPKKVLKGDSSILDHGLVLKVSIKEISDDSYVAETSSNFSDAKIDFKVELIQ